MWKTCSQNTTNFITSYRWYTSCQQLHVAACIPAIIRLYYYMISNYTIYTVSVIKFEYNLILVRSNEMQQYAGIYLLQNNCTCSGVNRAHHQEYKKL